MHLSVPVDVAKAAVSAAPIPAPAPVEQGAAPADILNRAATLLNGATAPVVLLGVSAGRPAAAAAVRRFVRQHPLPVAMTFEAAGTLARDGLDRFVGRVGYVRNQPGDLVLQRADLVLAIGYDTVEYEPAAWNTSPNLSLIHLDELPATVDRAYRPAVEVIGDIARNLDALAPLVRLTAPAERPEVVQARKALLDDERRGAALTGSPVHPLRFMYDLRQTLGDDVTVTCDVGAHEIWMARHFLCYEPRHLLFSMGHQTMGVALPWAIGAALARPGRKAVSVSGDGSFLMTGMELETAVRLRLPIVHIVWKDGSYNLIKSLQARDYGRWFGAEFGNPDFVALGEAFGAAAFRITEAEEIVPVLKKALATEGPALIEVAIDYRDNHELARAMGASAQH